MPVPIVYRSGGDAVASYNWLDLASGCGYKRYYACISGISSGDLYLLTPESLVSYPSIIVSSVNNTAYATLADKDFDITFKKSAYIQGDVYVNVAHRIDALIAARTCYANIKILVYHYNGSVETLIGSAISALRYNDAAATPKYFKECIKVVCSGKQFSNGDILRITIQHCGFYTGGAGEIKLFIDPDGGNTYTDVDGRTINTTLSIDVPFKVDL